MRFLLSMMFVIAVSSMLTAQEAKQSASPTKILVELKPGKPGSKLAPRYSPPGRQLKLTAKNHPGREGYDHLETNLNLGPIKNDLDQYLIVARSEKGKPYDLLWVSNQGGMVPQKPTKITPKVIRNNIWSSFEGMVEINHGKPGQKIQIEGYPIALWIVVEKDGDVPPIIRISRRGFLHGEVKLGDASYDLILSDSNNDGVLAAGDWWELRGKNAKADGMRTVGDYAWAGGKAWQLELTGTNGRTAHVVSHDPGMTEEEDTIKRDRLRADRMAVRAAKPVPFSKDVDVTLKQVAEKKTAYFIKFETDWCMPCKQMSELVFTAKDVADAANGITCLIVDGDARKDLTEKHKVKAYPTGILFDANGEEIARYVGYQGVKETTAFLKKAKK